MTSDSQGNPTVLVVNSENKVELRSIKTSRAIKDKWLVTSGLQAGERVILEGIQKAKPGATVHPTEAPSSAAPAS